MWGLHDQFVQNGMSKRCGRVCLCVYACVSAHANLRAHVLSDADMRVCEHMFQIHNSYTAVIDPLFSVSLQSGN